MLLGSRQIYMSIFSNVRPFFSKSLSILAEGLRDVFATNYSLEILQHDDRLLVLKTGNRSVVTDKRFQTVKTGESVLATFDAIKSIDITANSNDDGPPFWVVSLNLNWHSSVRIGESSDATQASIVAAHMSTITGKKVRSL
jgi:hypothetical protein